ncbi:hypothetical protein TNCT_359611 [Trichonephila clavata]|uniref:Uncharacterized protein n=1 Tax=Trichonephila clavata TaxID=2740835 RepID=A0A8X6HB10_TRICU|nr:hypothetical protein TNCT_359611 [Trichonephila clavata]
MCGTRIPECKQNELLENGKKVDSRSLASVMIVHHASVSFSYWSPCLDSLESGELNIIKALALAHIYGDIRS